MKKIFGILFISFILSGNVFANHFSYKVPEVKVKEFDRWMGKLKRKDGKWGPTNILANGSVLAGGITKSLTSGFAEMIVTG